MKAPNVVVHGKDNGEGMVIHYQTTKGTGIFGLAVPNIRANSDWDLGPTWCYLIVGRRTTLIDAGRFGNFEFFNALLRSIQKELNDIDRIIVTHSHEDHDGNLAEILAAGRAELWAHSIYSKMISHHPRIVDGATHPEMPGSCRLCDMPESFSRECLPYLNKRSLLNVDMAVDDDHASPDDDLSFVFTPGHAPDSICIVLEDEVIFTGDTILPDITPHPSLAHTYEVNRRILPDKYRHKNTVYGLMTYIKSLHRIISLRPESFPATFPAHRLFCNGQFNFIHNPSDRAKEIIQFHIDRCLGILDIVEDNPLGVDEIAARHFLPSQLAGMGKSMARKEVMAHIEVMEESGDVRWVGANRDLVQRIGSNKYVESIIGEYLH